MGSLLAGADGQHRGRSEAHDQDQKKCDHGLPPAHDSPVSAVAGMEEVTFALAERRVTGRVGADPGGDVGGGLQQAAAVEVGRVAGVAGPLGCGVVQPGPGDPVGVGFGQPGVAQQRPGGQ